MRARTEQLFNANDDAAFLRHRIAELQTANPSLKCAQCDGGIGDLGIRTLGAVTVSAPPPATVTATAAVASSSSSSHDGEWKLHQNSDEFLAFPDELKANLRKEKKRKVEELRTQMQWSR
jgi:hypothetical protein